MKLRTGILFGFRGLFPEESQVISENLNKEKDVTYESSYQEPTLIKGAVDIPREVAPFLIGNPQGKYDWGVGYTQEQKEQNRKDAEKIYGTLDDYTFKLYLPCTVGTGWILDYQILQNKEKYPTKWYIATNMHVIWRLKFSNKNNDYGETLMYSNTDYLRNRSAEGNAKNYEGKVRDKCENIEKTGYFDMNFGNEKTWKQGRQSEFGAIDFLEGESKKVAGEYHFADFAVLEIEFTSSEEAKTATNGFAEKYKIGGWSRTY
ncbi:hypothetical protein A6V39_02740 [Candidatus Mycoplasma haematobovis]|uniref:DUF31 domain-containing protein n=1 Tax=Candidatus Mycoplasma haematobovis TaxID=432608 RepID=A0A1A9QEA0_9MOLU|nr:hypothetical protein [Candidatus Mycoplasma haematobovis]OAL10331.1 hypothetical protein A6V39_02740 [Candidatus Mycoplasma haematobovis]